VAAKLSGSFPQVGDEFDCSCTGLDELGAGVADVASNSASDASPGSERLRVHVAGLLPGERARVRLAHVSVHRQDGVREAWADLRALQWPNGERVSPWCPVFGTCGGCSQMHMGYPAQLAWKRARVEAQLAAHPALARVSVEPCVPSSATEGYRNQAKYVYGRDHAKGTLVLGAFAPRSHAIVDMAGCSMVEPAIERVRESLLRILVAGAVVPFDELRRTGVLRYVVVRATARAEVLVTLVVARSDWDSAEAIASALRTSCPEVTGVLLNLNASPGNVLFGADERLLSGRAVVEDVVGDVHVRLSSRSFFQVNRHVAGRIYRDMVGALAGNCQRAVDVFSGAGGIGLSLAPVASEVVAIEENAAATRAAEEFLRERSEATSTGPGNVRFLTGDAADCLTTIEAAEVVVLNPPRRGCAGTVLSAVSRLAPRTLLYLSCNPHTLVRDLRVLVDAGARLVSITPYDMMPHSPHVETLARLEWPG
jgi:23S rRNA (uracil1939-C5)-methyltransferase